MSLSEPFSCEEALRFGWKTTRANLKPLLILGAAGASLSALNQALMNRHGGGLPSLGVQILEAAVGLAFVRAALKLHDGQPVEISNLDELLDGFLNYLLTELLFALIFVGGLLLLIVPGVSWGLRFSLACFAVADGKTTPLAALRESSRLTDGVKWELFQLALWMLGLNALGALALGIGLFFTIPTCVVAGAFVFRRLQARAAQATGPVPVGHPPPAALAGTA